MDKIPKLEELKELRNQANKIMSDATNAVERIEKKRKFLEKKLLDSYPFKPGDIISFRANDFIGRLNQCVITRKEVLYDSNEHLIYYCLEGGAYGCMWDDDLKDAYLIKEKQQ